MSTASDFTSGVRLASDIKARGVRQDLMKRNMTMAEESHAANMGLNEINQGAAKERLSSLTFANSDEQRKVITDKQALQSQSAQFGLDEAKKQSSHAQWQRGNEKSDRVAADKNKKMLGALEQLRVREENGIDTTPEYIREIAPAFDGTLFDLGKFTQKGFMDDLVQLSGYANTNDSSKAGNDPAVIPLINRVYKSEINQGGGIHPDTGAEAVSKEIIAIRPDPSEHGRYIPSLRIRYADGSVRDDIPMTKGRSEKGEEVTSVHLRDLIDQVEVMKQFGKNIQPWLGAVKNYGKKGYDHKGKGSFDGFGQTRLDNDTFTKNYEQEFTIDDPINGRLSFVDIADVRHAGNDPKLIGDVNELKAINQQVHQNNLSLDDEEQQPFFTMRQHRQQKALMEKNNAAANKVDLSSSGENKSSNVNQPVQQGVGQLSAADSKLLKNSLTVQSPISSGLKELFASATKGNSRFNGYKSLVPNNDYANSQKEKYKLKEEHGLLIELLKSNRITPDQKVRLKELTAQLK